MNVEIQINDSSDLRARFIGWTPAPCSVRVTNPSGAPNRSFNLRLDATASAGGGALGFRAGQTGAFSSSLTLLVPITGLAVPFFVAGQFGQPSTVGVIRIDASFGTTVLGSATVMVRIRKNANTLTAEEQRRFLVALAVLNGQGRGRFTDFREIHQASGQEAHGGPAFLPWHRTLLLDIERELQAIDPTVALPYWRFDEPAPNVFTREFMGFTPAFTGVTDAPRTVQFSETNPLRSWVTDGQPGIDRQPKFDTATQPAPAVSTEAEALSLGTEFPAFRAMELTPHNVAHTSFNGFIDSFETAARDPLFFLLHCNVDRLWAKWQRANGRFDPAQPAAYDTAAADRIGQGLPDTMWPWNGVTTSPRPSTAPGGTLAMSHAVKAPGPQPRVSDALDYQGRINPASRLGFDYDDVPFS